MKRASLRGRLRWLMLGVLAAVLLPLGIFSAARSIREIDELMDGRLAQSAHTIQSLRDHAALAAVQPNQHGTLEVPLGAQSHPTERERAHTYESEVGFQVFGRDGKTLLSSTTLAELPPPAPGDTGFKDVQHDGRRWRIFTLPPNADGVVIRSGERYDSRRDILHALWIEHGLPPLICLPLLAVLVGWAVRRGLHPLQELREQLSARRPGSREPLRLEHPPEELQPVLAALNEQFARMEDALERERRFSADVAHELRTPVAATMVNLENAMAAPLPSEAHAAIDGARQGLLRLARRVEQLLALARLEADPAARSTIPVDLVALATAMIDELSPMIAEGRVELGVGFAADRIVVQGHEAALLALLRNLLDNALRHVPDGGKVQLSISATERDAVIEVIDDGEGIPQERRAAVFARFHREAGSRGEGYGLGLSIVQRAAQWHGASVELLDSPFGRGLRVRVAIPLRRDDAVVKAGPER